MPVKRAPAISSFAEMRQRRLPSSGAGTSPAASLLATSSTSAVLPTSCRPTSMTLRARLGAEGGEHSLDEGVTAVEARQAAGRGLGGEVVGGSLEREPVVAVVALRRRRERHLDELQARTAHVVAREHRVEVPVLERLPDRLLRLRARFVPFAGRHVDVRELRRRDDVDRPRLRLTHGHDERDGHPDGLHALLLRDLDGDRVELGVDGVGEPRADRARHAAQLPRRAADRGAHRRLEVVGVDREAREVDRRDDHPAGRMLPDVHQEPRVHPVIVGRGGPVRGST